MSDLRLRLHAVRIELDDLLTEIKTEEDACVERDGLEWAWAWWDARKFLERARIAVTSADKALAKGEDPREPSGVAPLKRITRSKRRSG